MADGLDQVLSFCLIMLPIFFGAFAIAGKGRTKSVKQNRSFLAIGVVITAALMGYTVFGRQTPDNLASYNQYFGWFIGGMIICLMIPFLRMVRR